MKGLPLVLLHGYPFDHSMWEPVVARLKPDQRFLSPDLPGFGSTAAAGEPSLDAAADFVAEQLPGPAVIAGFSMGGYVALAVAERQPTLVAGIALVNSQSAADTDEVRNGRRAVIEKVRKEGVSAATQAAFPKLFARLDPDWTRYATKGAERAGVAGITWALEAMARRPDRTPILKSLGKPVLIIHSREDKFIPVTRARDLAALLNAKYVEIPDVGHATPLESPQTVAAALTNFIDGH